MARKPVEIIGETEFAGRLVDAAGRIDRDSRRALSQTGVEVRRRMKAIAPVDDGDIKAAITMQSRGTRWRRTVIIGPERARINPTKGDNRGVRAQLYPMYQEFGTAHNAAQPFVGPSLDGAAERLTARLNAILRDI